MIIWAMASHHDWQMAENHPSWAVIVQKRTAAHTVHPADIHEAYSQTHDETPSVDIVQI